MPKKSTTTRSAAQRKPKTQQKSIELVRPVAVSDEQEQSLEHADKKEAALATPANSTKAQEIIAETQAKEISPVSTAPRGSAAAKLAARRNAAQKTHQRSTASLITAEHFAYVRKDLITIAILAVVMFAIIVTLYFVLSATLI